MAKITIDGKEVVLRDSVTFEEGYLLFGVMMEGTFKDLRTQLPLLTALVESWEFEGDPGDETSYQKLDLFRAAIPLVKAVNDHINYMMAEPKN